MLFIINLIRCIGLIALSPFKLVNYLGKKCQGAEKTYIVGIIGEIATAIIIIMKVGIADGKWIISLLLFFIIGSIVMVVMMATYEVIFLVLNVITLIPANTFDEIKEKISHDEEKSYQKEKEKRIRKATKNNIPKGATTKTSMNKQEDAGVSLEYFIEKEKKVIVPSIKYIGD